eukprot:scaffold138473_cov32-Tisochrysis_lutea.AAC.2
MEAAARLSSRLEQLDGDFAWPHARLAHHDDVLEAERGHPLRPRRAPFRGNANSARSKRPGKQRSAPVGSWRARTPRPASQRHA